MILPKLQFCGMEQETLKWFQSCLDDRKQVCCVNGHVSNLRSVSCGVPHDSNLGPLLFLIYIKVPTKLSQYGRNLLNQQQRKLLNQPELCREYDEIIRDQERAGIIEQIPDAHASKDCNVHYLPHHAVIRSDHDTTKLQVAYDGSAKTPNQEYSMNDCLANYTPQLIDIPLRFR